MKSLRRLKRPRLRFDNYESMYLTSIIVYVVADALFFATLPIYIREPIISQVSGVLLGIEGVLIGLAPTLRNKKMRTVVAYVGMTAILIAVLTFTKSTFEDVQLNYLSYFPTTLLFQATSSLFLGLIEIYALALLAPFTPRDPDKWARNNVAEAW